MNAQIGLEYMAILTLLIAFLVPLFYIANQQIEIARATSEAKTAVNTMVAAVNAVYAQSPGSKLTANVYIPKGYDNQTSYLANGTIDLRIILADGVTYDAAGFTKCNVTGRLPPYSGYHVMTFLNIPNNSVLINTTAK
jgi:hypothetical protein